MSTLPTLNSDYFDNKKEDKKEEVLLPKLDDSVEQPSRFERLKELDGYMGDSYEKVEKMVFHQSLNSEYERIKSDYSDLINSFQSALTNNQTEEKKIKHNFSSLADFENAVSLGQFNMDDYGIKEINQLLSDLEMLERRASERSLDDYGLETVSDFHKAVETGILNINKFSIREVNELLTTLKDDKPLTINDFNIYLYGDITINDVHLLVEQKEENIINNNYTNNINSESQEQLRESYQEKVNEDLDNQDLEEIEEVGNIDQIDEGFVDKIVGKLTGLFKKGKK